MCTYVHIFMHTYIYSCIDIYMRTAICTCTHTYIHTKRCTYIYFTMCLVIVSDVVSCCYVNIKILTQGFHSVFSLNDIKFCHFCDQKN